MSIVRSHRRPSIAVSVDCRTLTMKRLAVSLTAVASLILAGAAGADDETLADRLLRRLEVQRFQLWHNCEPMDFRAVFDSKYGEDDIELPLELLVLSRLRAARLYEASAMPSLSVHVHVVGQAFHVSLEYNKLVKDLASGLERSIPTWSTGSTGTYGQDIGYIVSDVSEHMDFFIDEYLRANAGACAR